MLRFSLRALDRPRARAIFENCTRFSARRYLETPVVESVVRPKDVLGKSRRDSNTSSCSVQTNDRVSSSVLDLDPPNELAYDSGWSSKFGAFVDDSRF